MKEYLDHLVDWIHSFPLPWEDLHVYGRTISQKVYKCLICGREEPVTDDEYESALREASQFEYTPKATK